MSRRVKHVLNELQYPCHYGRVNVSYINCREDNFYGQVDMKCLKLRVIF